MRAWFVCLMSLLLMGRAHGLAISFSGSGNASHVGGTVTLDFTVGSAPLYSVSGQGGLHQNIAGYNVYFAFFDEVHNPGYAAPELELSYQNFALGLQDGPLHANAYFDPTRPGVDTVLSTSGGYFSFYLPIHWDGQHAYGQGTWEISPPLAGSSFPDSGATICLFAAGLISLIGARRWSARKRVVSSKN
jgi:hypothetical protein